jgi:hypothetical protein
VSFDRARIPENPAEHEFETVIVSNLDPRPDDAPPVPAPVASLVKTLEAAGWTVRVGFSRAWRRAPKTGHYRKAEFFGVFAGDHPSCEFRVISVYWRFADKAELFAWYRDVMALELVTKASGEPAGWTWQDGRIVRGFTRHRVKVTDIKEFARVRGSVLPGWFAGIARRFAEQATKALCGALEAHDPHVWETGGGTAKSCSGKATKPKEVEAP